MDSLPRSRVALIAVPVLLSLAVGSCASESSQSAGPSTVAAGWQEVPIGAEVQSLGMGFYYGRGSLGTIGASGIIDDQPVLFAVDDSDFTVDPRPIPAVHGDAPTTFEGSGYLMAVSQSGSAEEAGPATLWVADDVEVYDDTGPSDEAGTPAQWLRPLMNDEGATRLAGLVPDDNALEVRAWQVRRSWLTMDAPGQLVATPMTTEVPLLAGTTDTSVVVAGLVTHGRTAGDELSVWSVSDYRIPGKGIWKEMKMASSPDSLSDLEDWPLGFWVAGAKDGEPVVYDFDEGQGASLAMPETRLDPANPVTFIAQVPVSSPLVIATQSTEGPAVWLGEGSRWTEITAPEGRLSDALVARNQIYLVIDGDLWRHPIEALS